MLRCAGHIDDMQIAEVWRNAWAAANPDIQIIDPIENWLLRVRDEFHQPSRTFVIEKHHQLVGFFVVNIEVAYLHQLFVAPKFQGFGYGTRMIKEICGLMPFGWTLHVATTNQTARDFYERQGLTERENSVNPKTGRTRVKYSWEPRQTF